MTLLFPRAAAGASTGTAAARAAVLGKNARVVARGVGGSVRGKPQQHELFWGEQDEGDERRRQLQEDDFEFDEAKKEDKNNKNNNDNDKEEQRRQQEEERKREKELEKAQKELEKEQKEKENNKDKNNNKNQQEPSIAPTVPPRPPTLRPIAATAPPVAPPPTPRPSTPTARPVTTNRPTRGPTVGPTRGPTSGPTRGPTTAPPTATTERYFVSLRFSLWSSPPAPVGAGVVVQRDAEAMQRGVLSALKIWLCREARDHVTLVLANDRDDADVCAPMLQSLRGVDHADDHDNNHNSTRTRRRLQVLRIQQQQQQEPSSLQLAEGDQVSVLQNDPLVAYERNRWQGSDTDDGASIPQQLTWSTWTIAFAVVRIGRSPVQGALQNDVTLQGHELQEAAVQVLQGTLQLALDVAIMEYTLDGILNQTLTLGNSNPTTVFASVVGREVETFSGHQAATTTRQKPVSRGNNNNFDDTKRFDRLRWWGVAMLLGNFATYGTLVVLARHRRLQRKRRAVVLAAAAKENNGNDDGEEDPTDSSLMVYGVEQMLAGSRGSNIMQQHQQEQPPPPQETALVSSSDVTMIPLPSTLKTSR